MCAARYCPQFASNMQATIDSAACWQPRECKCVLNCCHSHIITKHQVKRIFHISDARDVGKLKVQPQSCKVIPRAAPSVEVLSPKCNAPEIPKPLKASMLQGFFFKATTDGLR